MKTERTQIRFLSDVLVAVASLDLKVPNTHKASYCFMIGQTLFARWALYVMCDKQDVGRKWLGNF